MKRVLLGVTVFAAFAALVVAQRERQPELPVPAGAVQMEVHSVFPREYSPGLYQQVDQGELQRLAQQGWELVSVMPYIYRNEEHGPELHGPKPVVTQTYPAYFFKRSRGGPALR